MPLPQALAARLAKRGILKLPSQSKDPDVEIANAPQEEIIAEDYDETPQTEESVIPPPPEKFDIFEGWYSCPNKWNVYHECSPACQEQWKEIKEIDPEYNRKRLKMLSKYSLPPHWHEILDIGIRRYYYWNTETDLVAWLPPGHPKCRVSRSAAYLRKQMKQEREQRLKEEKTEKKGSEDEEESSDEEGDKKRKKRKASLSKEDAESEDSSAESDEGFQEKKASKEKKARESVDREKERLREKERARIKARGKDRKNMKRRNEDVDILDPMDPASYSDCPRGNWASGLPERNEAKTGVDPTATGPLFQMRPYPNPGAVLRANSAVGAAVGPKKPS